jgi:transposase
MVAANARTAVVFALSAGQAHDAPQARQLLLQLSRPGEPTPLLMDRAYEGAETRAFVMELGFTPVVPPKENRLHPWQYDKELYKRRNEVERLFRRLKAFRRLFTRFEKLDVMFIAFIHFVLIVEALRESLQLC